MQPLLKRTPFPRIWRNRQRFTQLTCMEALREELLKLTADILKNRRPASPEKLYPQVCFTSYMPPP